MAGTETITYTRLVELLCYDPNTGVFTRRRNQSNTKKGDIAGSVRADGYLGLMIDDINYLQHRLAFLYMTQTMPLEVDHRNRKRADNRWTNLRIATRKINNQNASLRRDNASGFCGVNWREEQGKWSASIRVNKKSLHLGSFKLKNDAITARKQANKRYRFSEGHGQQRPVAI